MNRIYIIAFIFGFSIMASAQSTNLQLISGGGGIVQSGNIRGSFTIGEVVISTGRSANNILTQGFQQTSIFITSTAEVPRVSKIKVFPNPFKERISISFLQLTSIERVVVVDLNGRIVNQQFLSYTFHQDSDVLTIDIPSLAPGLYVLQVYSTGNQLTDNYSLIKI